MSAVPEDAASTPQRATASPPQVALGEPPPAATPPPTPDLAKVYGWFSIAAELDVCERTAKAFAARDRDPLPIEYGHLGAWAYRFAITAWIRRQNRPYGLHLELLRLQKEAQGLRTKAARQKKQTLRGAAAQGGGKPKGPSRSRRTR